MNDDGQPAENTKGPSKGPTVVFSIPKERCKEVTFMGQKLVQVDIGLTTEELILMLMRWESSGNSFGAVIRKKEED